MDNREIYKRVQNALDRFGAAQTKTLAWNNKRVVIYGAGGFGRDLAAVLLKQKIEILGFLDRKGTGQTILGDLRAHTPGSAEAKGWAAKSPVVFIGTHNGQASMREIGRTLGDLGFGNVVTPMESYQQFSGELGWRYWLGIQKDYATVGNQIEQTRSLWADNESERVFLEALIFRLEFDLDAASPTADVSYQYADPSLPRWEEPLRIVDGGAFDGDTLARLREHGYRFEMAHSFEPDLDNFRKLRDSVVAFSGKTEISLWPCGVGSTTCRLKFSEGGGTSSKLSETGTAHVPVVALDDVLHGQPVNLIKLDIEGAEPDALEGARGLIEKYRPGLAVCLYHYPHHLWSIPLWVANLNLGYRLYCRAYAYNTFETILYAMPS